MDLDKILDEIDLSEISLVLRKSNHGYELVVDNNPSRYVFRFIDKNELIRQIYAFSNSPAEAYSGFTCIHVAAIKQFLDEMDFNK